LGKLQSLLLTENAQLLTFIIDDAQLWCPNLIIQASEFSDSQISLTVDFNVPSILTDEKPEVN
jgi:hypothetical protein